MRSLLIKKLIIWAIIAAIAVRYGKCEDIVKLDIKDIPPVDFGPIRVGPFDSKTTIKMAVDQYNKRVQQEEWFIRFPKLTVDELTAGLFDSDTLDQNLTVREEIHGQVSLGRMPNGATLICEGGSWFKEIEINKKQYVLSKYDIAVEVVIAGQGQKPAGRKKILIRRKYENVYTRAKEQKERSR